jgi:hypothetical protein
MGHNNVLVTVRVLTWGRLAWTVKASVPDHIHVQCMLVLDRAKRNWSSIYLFDTFGFFCPPQNYCRYWIVERVVRMGFFFRFK